MTVKKRIIAGLAANLYGRGVLVLGQVLIVPVFLARWGSAGYGEWVALSALSSYLSYTNLGMPGALRSHLAMAYGEGNREAMRVAFQSSLALISTISVLIGCSFIAGLQFVDLSRFFHLEFLNNSEAKTVASVLSIQIVIYAISSVISAAVSAIGRYAQAWMIDAHRQSAEFSGLILLVGALHLPPEKVVFLLPLSWVAVMAANVALLVKHAPWLLTKPFAIEIGVLRRLAEPMLGVLGMSFGYGGMSIQAPRIILGATAGPQAVAIYSLAAMMTRIARIPIDVPAHAATVEISMAAGGGDNTRARELLQINMAVCLWMAFGLIPVVVLLGPTIAHIWTNGRIDIPRSLLCITAVSTIFYSLAIPSQEGLMAVNRLGRATVWLVVLSPIYVLGAVGLARVAGVHGIAAAVVILDAAYAGLGLMWTARVFSGRPLDMFRGALRPPWALIFSEGRRLAGRITGRST